MKRKILPKIHFNKYYFLGPLLAAAIATLTFGWGYLYGTAKTLKLAQESQNQFINQNNKELSTPTPTPTPTSAPKTQKSTQFRPDYTGPELWEAVNNARITHGVSPLKQKDILCTIAAIRLNQIRELGKLDNHDGFDPVVDKYQDSPGMPNNVSEFLISGYPTPDQAVEGWLNTLGHKKLITGGEYVWGCIYAANGFAVATTGF